MFLIWSHLCVPFCMIEYTVSRRHGKTWNWKPWAKEIHWFMPVGSSGECAGAWWTSGGLAGPLVLGMCSGDWEAAAARPMDVPCSAETPSASHTDGPFHASQSTNATCPMAASWLLQCGCWFEGHFVAEKWVDPSKGGVVLFQWKRLFF